MIYDLNYHEELYKFRLQVDKLINKKAVVELNEKKLSRTLKQNNAIHLYCKMIAETMNERGEEFTFTGFKGEEMKLRYTKDLVMETLWRVIQVALFKKASTTQLTREEVSEIALVIERFFADKGINLPFPNKDYLDRF